ncbi:MAG: sigma 54-interacting transcriptional regulator [Syntrophomonas sp.]|uniref:sigma 54-interacting transcriptional regulator n=1 Tax=Syntrophomonas sp. TaxID=2053627 RepID=UPI0026306AE3|nr:sigma 54-interacting transcriptional regulator [Syntrophomonas sp.]MDD2510147.1 sigma 54-interacting transcriptional regulator [Syntrophomonas sp.]MDD3878919.1 sigma 54-interacting transcriptional regulator [Syntrophomonas sp.]MDD4625978.1 sigma 54-interacting transcriptional regulator [Syntrophomonas sp.]
MNSSKTSINPYIVGYDTSLEDISLIFDQGDSEFLLVCDATKHIIGRIFPINIAEAIEHELAFDTPVQQFMPFEQQFTEFIRDLQSVLEDPFAADFHSTTGNETEDNYFQLIWKLCRIWQKNVSEWEACFDSVYNPVISVDEEGRINLFNRALERVSGISASDARGQKVTDVFTNSKLIDVLNTGQTQATRKIQYQDKILLTNRTPLYKNRKITGAVAVLQDISELEHIAEQLARTRELNRQLDAIFESSFDGLYLTDGEGNTLRLNQGFERITGIRIEECVGSNMRELVDTGVFSDSGTLLALEKQERATITLVARTGKEVLVTSTPIFDENGKIAFIITNVRDITELNELERKLKHVGLRDRELDTILDSSFDGIFITDGEANTLRLNQAFERITGVTAEECVGRNMKELVAKSYFSGSGSLLVLETKERTTITLVTRTGKEVLVTSTPIFDDQGDIMLIVTNVRDITELNELEREFKKMVGLREQELDAVFESSYDGLYITDGEANTLRLNEAFERILGVKAEECIGRNMKELVAEGVYSRSGTLLALEEQGPVTITLQAKTGKTALVTSTPIRDEHGNIILVVTNVRDISELNELEEKLGHAEGLSRFFQSELQEMKLRTQCVIHSSKMRELISMVVRVAAVDSTVLIQGESGVGKELVANTIHSNSNRREQPMIKINCGAIPENLLESELFGYEPGAFTGASKQGKVGMFEVADQGTLFLDEIGDLPLGLQVKLLRVLQDKEILRVGGTKPIKVDVRILAGTNYNLLEMVDKKLFRKDLFYRLNVIPITVPPLRERRDDIPILANHFLDNFNQKHGLNKKLSGSILAYFMEYDWPGNVRELENLIERLVVTSLNQTITAHDLSAWSELKPQNKSDDEHGIVPLQDALEKTERRILENAFSVCKSTYEVARALGISQPTVVRKAAKYGIRG